MNRIEQLIEEYGSLNFHFKEDMPDGLGGLFSDNNIYVNTNEPFERLYSNLAEEIVPYETAPGDIIDLGKLTNRKYKLLGRKRSYKKLVPYDKLNALIEANEVLHSYELVEEFRVPDDVVEEAIQMYRVEGKI